MAERIQKLLARAGLGSRRKLEADIAAGEVVLNGRTAELGMKAQTGDRLRYGHQRYRVVTATRQDFKLIAYHKPVGRVTTRADEQNRPTVFEHLPRLKGARWIAIGRLDINTSGLLLFTDNGDLAHRLMHPSSEIEREYACRIRGVVEEDHIRQLHDGVELDDGPARFQRCWFDGGTDNNQWYRVIINEGRNREVRRLWMSLGYQVSRLTRVRYGPVRLPPYLRMGKFADVDERLVNELRAMAGLLGNRDSQLRLVSDTGARGRPRSGRRRPPGRRT